MTIGGYKIVWESQLPNLSERIKANFYANVNQVATAATETAIHEAALVTKAYVVGLLDAEALNQDEAGILAGMVAHIENEAKAKLSKAPHAGALVSFGSNVHTLKFKTSTGDELSVDLSEASSFGKGNSFLFGANKKPSGFDPLAAARRESVFMLQLLEHAAGVTLDENQRATFISVLADLPEGATVIDLLDAILGIEPEEYKPLEPLFKALQRMQEQGVYAGLFEQRVDV